MKTFFLCMFGSAVVVYAAVMLLYMIAGDAAWLIAGLLALGAVFGLLAILGIVNDPTTQGYSDSTRAMGYDTPAK